MDDSDRTRVNMAKEMLNSRRDLMDGLVELRKAQGIPRSVVAASMDGPILEVVEFEKRTSNPSLESIHRYALAVGAVVSHSLDVRVTFDD